MDVSHVFQIIQMVQNSATHHKYRKTLLVFLISSYFLCFLDSNALIKNCPNILGVFKEPLAKKMLFLV